MKNVARNPSEYKDPVMNTALNTSRNDASAIIENANVQVDLPSGVWVRCPSECTEQQAPDSSAAESRQVDPGGG